MARKEKANLKENITHLIETEKTDNNNWIFFEDSTGTVIPYYKAWLMVQYCIDIKKQSFDRLLSDTADEAVVNKEMLHWYKAQL